jgi:hypothetical protein
MEILFKNYIISSPLAFIILAIGLMEYCKFDIFYSIDRKDDNCAKEIYASRKLRSQ